MRVLLLACVVLASLFIIGCESADSYPFWKVFTQTGPIYRGRADPIVNPGVLSGHTHKVFGASGFSLGGPDVEQVYDEMMNSTCTTASITIDKSAYWIPDLYYEWPNGTFSLIPNGGLTVYYIGRSGTGAQKYPEFKPFPKGFRMLAGDPFRRSFNNTTPEKAITFACLSKTEGPSAETNGFPSPSRFCDNGLRAQVFFPSCWDGRLDTPNHKDHVAYPTAYNTGNCPESHPLRLQAIFYEVLFSVSQFPNTTYQPYRFANGDPTGYGLHGDFLNGWPVDIFQQALTDVTCFANSTNNGNNVRNCLTLKPYVKDSNPEGSCLLDKPIANFEDVGHNHVIDHLAGCNPITYGPQRAVPCSTITPQPRVSIVYRVLIKSARNGKFVSARSQNDPLTADHDSFADLSYDQVFDLTPVTDTPGVYTIQPESNSRFVSANNRANTPIIGNRPAWSTWETWGITFYGASEPTAEGTLATILSFSNNKFVQTKEDGDLQANSAATQGTISVNEQFYLYDANAL